MRRAQVQVALDGLAVPASEECPMRRYDGVLSLWHHAKDHAKAGLDDFDLLTHAATRSSSPQKKLDSDSSLVTTNPSYAAPRARLLTAHGRVPAAVLL